MNSERGFYFNDEGKINLNLSDYAREVIDDDIKNFSNGEKYNWSGFLNRIFENFYVEAEASIFERCIAKRDEYNKMFSASPRIKGMDKKTTKIYIDELVEVYKSALKKKVISYEKGEGKRFRLNNDNVERIEQNFENASYYGDGSPSSYLKPIFEEYAKKSVCERERIYFAQTVDEINKAIALKKKLKITMIENKDAEGKPYKSQFYFSPYKIVQDKAKTYNYLVGYSQKIGEENTEGKFVPVRISRIEKVRCERSMGGALSKEAKKKIDDQIRKKGVQYISGELVKIQVKFTKTGEKNLTRHLFMRPQEYEKKDNGVYVFNCTEFQLINYLFKFGKDAQVISPASTREKMMEMYKQAYEEYIKE